MSIEEKKTKFHKVEDKQHIGRFLLDGRLFLWLLRISSLFSDPQDANKALIVQLLWLLSHLLEGGPWAEKYVVA